MIGQTTSHYNILEKLGQGGMGVVYKAEDTKLLRAVAIKFLPHQIAAHQEERQRFKVEAQAAAALNHPNIATIYAIEEHEDELFIVMEYIEGKQLSHLIKSPPSTGSGQALEGGAASAAGGVLSLDDVLNYATQIAAGLQAAHEKGIVHRDIKSANIMVTDRGQVKIMDFGLAKIRGSAQLTKVGTTLGTAAYTSPEQARGENVDHRTDIWAFGVVLYEMLTGQLPFRGEYEQAVIYAILNEEPEYSEEIPANLQPVLQKALAKDADERYQDMEQVLAELKSFDAGQASAASKPVRGGFQPAFKKKWGALIGGVAILALVAAFAFFLNRSQSIDSIAVLPFHNANNDPDLEYLGDGLTETLINKLSQLPQLRVMARSTVFHYKGKNVTPRQAGKELGVKAVFSGEIVQRGEALRVYAELVDVSDGTQIWGRQYHRVLDNLFAVQDTISEQITSNLRLKLSGEQKNRLATRDTENSGAYQLYLKGRYFWNKRSKEGMNKSISYFQQAIETDPGFALAYAGLADAYITLGDHNIVPSNQAYPKARAAAEQALKIDPQLSEAHTAVAYVKYIYDWQWAEAEKGFRKAIALNPRYPTAHQWYAEFLMFQGRFDEALAEIRLAKSLDPLSLIINTVESLVHYYARDYEQAIKLAQKVVEMDAGFVLAHAYLYLFYHQSKLYSEEVREFTTWSRLAGYSEETLRLWKKSLQTQAMLLFTRLLHELQSQMHKGTMSPILLLHRRLTPANLKTRLWIIWKKPDKIAKGVW